MILQRIALASVALMLLPSGCESDTSDDCNLVKKGAVIVRIDGSRRASIVSANHDGTTEDCESFVPDDVEDAGSSVYYGCWETEQRPAGKYTVRVTSDDDTWSQSVDVAGNSCHISQAAKLTFDLDSKPD